MAHPSLLRGALLLALCLPVASAQNRIAFISPTGQLATVAPDGRERRALTPAGRVFQFPAWSPGGERIAAIASDAAGGAVYALVDAEDANLVELYRSRREPPIYLYWSPDSTTLSFLANNAAGLGLHLASLQSLRSRLLTTGNPFYWQWSLDGTHLFAHIGLGKGSRLGFLEPGRGELRGSFGEPGLFNAPGISRSERYLAYAEVDAGGVTKLILESNLEAEVPPWTRNGVRREVPYEGLLALSWSPAEEVLAFMSSPVPAPHPYGPIRLLDAASGELRALVEETALAFFWSPDGRYIAYLTPAQDEGGGQLAGGLRQVSAQPVQSAPLFLELAVAEVVSGQARVLTTFAPTPLFLDQFLPFFDQYALSHNLWSPRSDALVLPMLGPEGRPQVVVVPLEGEPRAVAAGEMPFWSEE